MFALNQIVIVRFLASALMLAASQTTAFAQGDYGGRAQAEAEAAEKMMRRSSERKSSGHLNPDSVDSQSEPESSEDGYPLAFTMKMLDGTDRDLSDYRGNPLLIVNTASKCGFTPQYKGLQSLHDKFAEQGLRVIGVPCNQFRNQEPGSAEQIAEFCSRNYGVTFDMFAKVDVKGEKQCELYKYLTRQESSPKSAGEVSWNFEKFLIDGGGNVIARYGSRVKPNSNRVTREIKKLLSSNEEVDSGSE